MAAGLVQKMAKKSIGMLTVINLGKVVYDKLKTIIQNFSEIIVIFYIYSSDSLKSTTRQTLL